MRDEGRSGRPARRRAHQNVAALGAAALCTSLSLGAASIAGSAAAGATGTGATTTLTEDVLPGLSLLSAGPVAPNTILHVGVALAAPDAAAEQSYQSALYDKSSPDYHHFLTPAEFDATFGVAPSAVHSVQSWLIGGGIAVTYTAGSGDWIQATGTVANIERLMHVTEASYTSKGRSFIANEQAPTVPAGAGIVSVVGLNTLQKFSTPSTPVGQPAGTPVPPSTGCAPSCDYTPQQLWSMYSMPTGDRGEGETMGVFGEGRTDDVISNLRSFEAANKLPQVPVNAVDVGAGPFTDDSGQIEWDLDTQASTGMAPMVESEKLYFASSLADADVETAFSAWVSDPNGPLQANASFGECETDPGNAVWNAEPGAVGQFVGDGDNLEPVAESTLEQATIEGRTLFASAGDTGSSCPLAALPVVGAGNGLLNQGQPLLNYPCSSDYAVCVGGTVLYSNGANPPARELEYSWPYTGGGSSAFHAEPSWQSGVSAIDHPCVVDASGSPYPSGTICRGAPDVAAMSGDIATNGYDIYANGAPTTEGGTSLSSPLWVGMWTRVQSAAPNTAGLGFADPSFYAIGTGKIGDYAKDFTDITLGTNGLYQAGTGWDYVSGWGVPIVNQLTRSLDGKVSPTNPTGPGKVGRPPLPACPLLWQNPSHTATDVLGNSDPQLSLVNGQILPSKDKSSLLVTLRVADLSATVPAGASAADWYMTWTAHGTTYFAQAQLGPAPGSTFTYDDGTVQTTGTDHSYSIAHTDTGTFTPGANGSITIDVPRANVGNPALSSTLSSPSGATYTEEGAPPNPSGVSGGFLEAVDSGGPGRNYVVGTTC